MTIDEREAFAELKSMSREELDKVPFDLMKWRCDCKGCTNSRKCRDYGIAPIYYRPVGRGKWLNAIGQGIICSKHSKFWERLEKAGFSHDHILNKLIDRRRPLNERIILVKSNAHPQHLEGSKLF
jgi:hypothetical protein